MEISLFYEKNRVRDYGENESGEGTSREHLRVTADQERQNEIHQMKVTEIQDISPTVKKLVLSTPIKPAPFDFKAGQWVDLFIPNIKTVGGFSMISSPHYLKKTGNLELAVKYSEHPPAHWAHTKCQVNSQVSVRVGGDFFLDTKRINDNNDILLIAGGVGINPLCSMVNEIVDSTKDNDGKVMSRCRTTLLFSAKTVGELLFRDKFDSLSKQEPNFKVHYFLTGERGAFIHDVKAKAGRIGHPDITRVLEVDFQFRKPQVYICGPPPLIKDVESTLTSLWATQLFYETWWT